MDVETLQNIFLWLTALGRWPEILLKIMKIRTPYCTSICDAQKPSEPKCFQSMSKQVGSNSLSSLSPERLFYEMMKDSDNLYNLQLPLGKAEILSKCGSYCCQAPVPLALPQLSLMESNSEHSTLFRTTDSAISFVRF